ncbi:MAG TPA: 7-cyano-7-deazaguanine synthase [Candidatus Thermoplasmatota archaeon]|nr:7-cyano-7-deazaguanine synthase [Candidatus Thermoplasmatota archaeon]
MTFPDRVQAIVLLSGGLDSAVALWWAKAQGWSLTALSLNYHERPRGEIVASRVLAARVGAEYVEVDLPFVREALDIPGVDARLQQAPQGYVPGRNLLFYAVASYYADARGARHLVGGHTLTDPDAFPDASPAFFSLIDEANRLGRYRAEAAPLTVVLPLRALDKQGVVALGRRLGVPLDLTWSCYHDAVDPCGACVSCVERSEAFLAAGVPAEGQKT